MARSPGLGCLPPESSGAWAEDAPQHQLRISRVDEGRGSAALHQPMLYAGPERGMNWVLISAGEEQYHGRAENSSENEDVSKQGNIQGRLSQRNSGFAEADNHWMPAGFPNSSPTPCSCFLSFSRILFPPIPSLPSHLLCKTRLGQMDSETAFHILCSLFFGFFCLFF